MKKIIYHVIFIILFAIIIAQEIEPEITLDRKKLVILTSEDEEIYSHLGFIENNFPDNKEGTFTKDFTYDIGYKLGPRINAGGRVGGSMISCAKLI